MGFLNRTLIDPSLFWPALEALATLVAAGIIIWQLRRLREETVAHRFEGFRYAMQLISAPEFQEQAASFHELLNRGDPHQFRQSMPPLVHWILRTLEIIDRLIEDGYLEEGFFFRIEGMRLAHLARHIRMMEEGRDTPRFEEQISLYPNGRDLLRRAETWDDSRSSPDVE
jgi:hypothetical protein